MSWGGRLIDGWSGRVRVCAGLLTVAVLGAIWTVPTRVEGSTETAAMRAADLLDTFGVNIHIGSDPYNDPAALARMLGFLGILNVRQSSPIDAAGLATMQALGRLGAKFDLIVNGGGPVDLKGALRTIDQMAPYLNAIEGVNEAVIYPITYEGIRGVDAAVALQKDLYRAIRGNSDLAGVPVYMFTLGGVDPGAFPSIGDLSAHADFANIHSYPPHGLRPIFVIHAAIDGGRTSAPSKPVVITETGYYTLPDHAAWGGVPEAMQASYLLCLLLDEAAAKVQRTYIYDLIDDGPDPQRSNREDNFGLFRHDGSPKPAATAIHNMHAILADAGKERRTFASRSFSFRAEGVPYDHTGNTLLVEKSDGTTVIALWNEQQLWDPDTRAASPLRHVPVHVTFPAPQQTVLLHDPLVGTSPVQTYNDIAAVTIDLADHPVFLVIPAPRRHATGENTRRPSSTSPSVVGVLPIRNGGAQHAVSVVQGPDGDLGAVDHADLPQDGFDMHLHGCLRDVQCKGNRLVRGAIDEVLQDLAFARGQGDVLALVGRRMVDRLPPRRALHQPQLLGFRGAPRDGREKALSEHDQLERALQHLAGDVVEQEGIDVQRDDFANRTPGRRIGQNDMTNRRRSIGEPSAERAHLGLQGADIDRRTPDDQVGARRIVKGEVVADRRRVQDRVGTISEYQAKAFARKPSGFHDQYPAFFHDSHRCSSLRFVRSGDLPFFSFLWSRPVADADRILVLQTNSNVVSMVSNAINKGSKQRIPSVTSIVAYTNDVPGWMRVSARNSSGAMFLPGFL